MALSLTSLIDRLLRVRAGCASTADAALLERFALHRDEAAFETLLWRHGPMVLATCRRILASEQDAEDAFQATFFVLARKASSVGRRDSLPGWLHRVAQRIALRAQRQRRFNALVIDLPAPESADHRETRLVLEEEIQRLPEKYRVPFVLCYLQGQTNAQAAVTLACPAGTIATRLAWARARLQARLIQRGITLSVAAALVLLTAEPVAAALVHATARAARTFADNLPLVRLSPRAVAWTRGELRTMLGHKITLAGALLLGLGLVIGAGTKFGQSADNAAQAQAPQQREVVVVNAADDKKDEDKRREEARRRELEEERLQREWKRVIEDLTKQRVELRVSTAELQLQVDDLWQQYLVASRLEGQLAIKLETLKLATPKDKGADELKQQVDEARAKSEGLKKRRLVSRRDLVSAEETLAMFYLEQERQLDRIRRHPARGDARTPETPGASNRELERKIDQFLKELRELKKQLEHEDHPK